MAEIEITKQSDIEKKSIILAKVEVQAPDRTPKDIANWIRAIEAAESVYWPQRVELLDLYSRLELDGHFTGTWEKRIAQVLNKKLRFVRKKQKDDSFDTLISSDMFRSFVRLRMEKKSHGVRGAEFIPGPTFTWLEIPAKHIKPEKRVIAKQQYDNSGDSYDGVWNLFIMADTKDKGFLLRCAPYILWKQGVFGDWAEFIEIFGLPVRLFKYDVYDEKTKAAAADLQKNAGSATSMIIPKQLEYEAQDGKTSNANGELQDKFRKACNEELSVIVLSNTETTTSSKSSGYAQSETHADQQQEIIQSDMQDVLNTLNSPQFLRILQSYGYNVTDGAFEFEEEVNIDKLAKKKSLYIDLGKVIPIDDDFFYETFAVPKPKDYAARKAAMEAERQARIQKPAGNPDPQNPPKKTAKPAPKSQHAEVLTWVDKFRQKLADFFDRARND